MLPRLVYCELSFSYPYRRRFTAGTSRMRLASANPLEDQVLLLTIKIVLPSLPASCVSYCLRHWSNKRQMRRHFPVRTGPSAKGSTRLYLAIALRVEESLHGASHSIRYQTKPQTDPSAVRCRRESTRSPPLSPPPPKPCQRTHARRKNSRLPQLIIAPRHARYLPRPRAGLSGRARCGVLLVR